MNKKKLRNIINAILFIVLPHQSSFSLDEQNDKQKPQLTHPIENHIPFLQTSQTPNHLKNHFTAIEHVNQQLFSHFGSINPSIKLDPSTHDEISRLSTRYESFPTNVAYDYDNNQVTLTWHRHIFGIRKSTIKTFKLASKSHSKLKTRSTIAIPSIQKPILHSSYQPIHNGCLKPHHHIHFNNSTISPVEPFSGIPTTIHQAQSAFLNIYEQYPDICNNFVPEPYAYYHITQDFLHFGHPNGLDIALDDNGVHVLILKWNNNVQFHYRLQWIKR